MIFLAGSAEDGGAACAEAVFVGGGLVAAAARAHGVAALVGGGGQGVSRGHVYICHNEELLGELLVLQQGGHGGRLVRRDGEIHHGLVVLVEFLGFDLGLNGDLDDSLDLLEAVEVCDDAVLLRRGGQRFREVTADLGIS